MSAPAPETALPNLEEPQRIDPRSVIVGRIGGWIFVLVLAAMMLPGFMAGIVFVERPSDLIGLAFGTFAALTGLGLVALAAHIRPLWRYEYTRYRIDPYGIEISSGRFFRHVITVPHARVQHIDVLQGPIERRYDLANLVIYTAGTTHSAVKLSGLSHPMALALRERLLKERGLDAV
ncbi:MAG TPA: PH domain-containing protein [Vicinamibacterales bacterium]|nr:PH domain-containing protein [Vicinamibacterales bacterium]